MRGTTYRLPFALSRRIAGAGTFESSSLSYDFAIAGIPFLSAISDRDEMLIQMVPREKDQIDTTGEAGENTLEGWWLRSQSTFHGGAGQLYFDARDQDAPTRFFDSAGVDPWTPGKLTVLKKTTQQRSASGAILLVGASDGTNNWFLQAETSTLNKVQGGSSTSVTWGGAGTIVALVSDGGSYYAADSTSIYKGTIAGGAGAAIWNTGNANIALGFVKQRLVAGIGASIYELVSGGPALPTAKYTHPATGWKWTSITEGPKAIYAAGFSGDQSAIFMFTVGNDGTVPTLTSGVLAAELPRGEIVHKIYGYLGRFVGIGTNMGLRIGVIDTDTGFITYGPLTIENVAVKAMVGEQGFLYAGYTNSIATKSGLARVDLGTQFDDGRFAYASDLQTGVTGTVSNAILNGMSGQLVIGVDGAGSYMEHATDLETVATLTTSRVRYGTLEPKFFKFVRLRATFPNQGSLALSTISETGSEVTVVTYATPPDTDVALLSLATPQEFIQLKFTIQPATTSSPVLSGWQLKSIPGVRRQQVWEIPLLCFDYEKDRYGMRDGFEGYAFQRYDSLLNQIRTGDTVLFQNLNTGKAELVIVEQLQFKQASPPGSNTSSFGGILTAQVRTVAS